MLNVGLITGGFFVGVIVGMLVGIAAGTAKVAPDDGCSAGGQTGQLGDQQNPS